MTIANTATVRAAGNSPEIHVVCPGCGAEPTIDKDANGAPIRKGGTEHVAMLQLHDPEAPDQFLYAHEYGVCDDCHAAQYKAFYSKDAKRSTVSKIPLTEVNEMPQEWETAVLQWRADEAQAVADHAQAAAEALRG